MVRLHRKTRVNYSEQYCVSFQTGKILFELHIKWGYNGSIGLRQKLELPGLLLMQAISSTSLAWFTYDFKTRKQRNIAHDNDIQVLKAPSIKLKTNFTSTSLWAYTSNVKIISHKKRLKTNRRRYFKAPIPLTQDECLVLNR